MHKDRGQGLITKASLSHGGPKPTGLNPMMISCHTDKAERCSVLCCGHLQVAQMRPSFLTLYNAEMEQIKDQAEM